MGEVFPELVVFLLTFPVAYLVGQFNEKKKNRRLLIEARVDDLVELVRRVSDDAQQYFVVHVDERERLSATVLLQSNLMRVSTGLIHLGRLTGDQLTYARQWIAFHRSITEDPFGRGQFAALDHSDPRLASIRTHENQLIVSVRRAVETQAK